MLPDYPKVKTRLMEFFTKVAEEAHNRRLGIFGTVKSSIMHEGEADVIIREDGSVDEIIPRAVKASAFIPASSPNVDDLNCEQIIKSFSEVGRSLADSKARVIVESIERSSAKVGNIVGPNSDPVEQFFEMVGKTWIDFDRQRRPKWPQLVVGSKEMAEAFRQTMKRIDSTPDLRLRMELLLEQKRRQFLDREASRKLVD